MESQLHLVTELHTADPTPVLSQGDAEFYKLCLLNLSMWHNFQVHNAEWPLARGKGI